MPPDGFYKCRGQSLSVWHDVIMDTVKKTTRQPVRDDCHNYTVVTKIPECSAFN